MTELIRYAFGQSSLGDFLAAVSHRGLVAFEFAERRAAAVDELRRRFPGATVTEDITGLSETVGRLAAVVDHPERDPDVALDIRGSAYEARVWQALRNIPAGRTASYGDIAAGLGAPLEAREVADACAANPIAILIPCHRVVKQDGSVSGYRWGIKRKRALLSREQNASGFQLS